MYIFIFVLSYNSLNDAPFILSFFIIYIMLLLLLCYYKEQSQLYTS